MNAAFEHIKETRYLLAQVFESGFSSGRNVSIEFEESAKAAAEIGMAGGAELLRELKARLASFAAGQSALSAALIAYCNAVSYYTMSASMLTVETMSTKQDAESTTPQHE